MNAAMKKARCDDDVIIKKLDVSQLTMKQNAAIDAVTVSYAAKMSSQERKIGALSTSFILAPSNHKALMQEELDSEKAILESIVQQRLQRVAEVTTI